MFNSISQFCSNYYDQLPADGFKAAALSVTLSFTASVMAISLSSPVNQAPSLSRVVLATGIAVTATAIHVATTPIFNYIFDNPTNAFHGWLEFVRFFVDMTLTHLLINHATAFKINLLTSNNIQKGNFIILPSNIIKAGIDMVLRPLNLIDPAFANDIRNVLQNCGMNFNQNFTPIYVTI